MAFIERIWSDHLVGKLGNLYKRILFVWHIIRLWWFLLFRLLRIYSVNKGKNLQVYFEYWSFLSIRAKRCLLSEFCISDKNPICAGYDRFGELHSLILFTHEVINHSEILLLNYYECWVHKKIPEATVNHLLLKAEILFPG